ncbi:MAG TPA: histidine kinase, partial [Niabella sp.]|nr:histidine kinase [Niabella sp.]
LTIALFLATAWISVLLGNYIINPIINILADNGYVFRDEMKPIVIHRSMMGGLRGGLTTAGIAAAIKLMKHWYVKEQRNLQLQKENVESQLQLLKAQVHPHFLFNTLNNIYSHTQDTAPEAAKLITGLSDILRFILYEGNNAWVPLSRELQMIRDYINLEKIRYGNRLELHLDLPDQTDELYITPLLLLPLVENSFKHGASSMLDQPWINMKVTINGNRMHMKLVNGKTGVSQPAKSSGIGIRNVKTRLALLYPGRHEFTITNEEEVFILNMKVELERKSKITVVKTVLPEVENIQKQV